MKAQKFFFLLDRKVSKHSGGPFFRFRPYAYGPFDEAVYNEIEAPARAGYVDIIGSPGDPRRKFQLTPQGRLKGRQQLKSLDEKAAQFMRELATVISDMSFAELVSDL